MRTSALFTAALILAACRSPVAPAVAPVDTAATLRTGFVEAFNRGDVAALQRLYAPDAILLAFTGQTVTSAEMIAGGLSRASSQFDLELEPLRVRASSDSIYEAGTWKHMEKGTRSVRDTGTYVWIWRKDAAGNWVIDIHAVNRKPR